MYDQCKIKFGRLLWNARRSKRISQRELCKIISNEYNHFIDYYELSKIENDQIDIRSNDYNWLIPIIAKIFVLKTEWLEQIRQQTEVEPLDLSQAVPVFPIYFNRKTYDL